MKILKGCREALHDGLNEMLSQMVAFMNTVQGRLKQTETQVNKKDEGNISLVDITITVSSLDITVE